MMGPCTAALHWTIKRPYFQAGCSKRVWAAPSGSVPWWKQLLRSRSIERILRKHMDGVVC